MNYLWMNIQMNKSYFMIQRFEAAFKNACRNVAKCKQNIKTLGSMSENCEADEVQGRSTQAV